MAGCSNAIWYKNGEFITGSWSYIWHSDSFSVFLCGVDKTSVSDDWLNLGIVYEFDTKDEGKIWISEELDIIIEDKNEDS